ncbi:MAG TPA: sensor domain-containing diguanylate cyclase [Steroidobacteraceae bacterium]|nr:sensor domain-containing diguanylate cyclase [Steroidobacteraceae bacterium]
MRRPDKDLRSRAANLDRNDQLDAEIRVLQARLSELTEEVSRNDALLRKTQERELELLRSGSLPQLLERMIHGLRGSYQLDAVTLAMHDPDHEVRHLLSGDAFRFEELPEVQFADELGEMAPRLSGLERPWLGPFRTAEHAVLLPGMGQVGSLALIPLRRNEQLDGVLVFFSTDPRRFTARLASDFLAHLGVVAAICLENAINRARLVRSGLTDFLTGFHNRRYLQARLCEELARAQRDQQPVACLMIDVDNFKRINDRYGHLAGDAVLREVAQRINDHMRLSDTGARFGGDEFAIVLPHGALADGERVALRVLEAVRGQPIEVGGQRSEIVTLSIGVAVASAVSKGTRDYTQLADRLIAEADAALYRAKSAGRNRVTTSSNSVC